MSNRQNPITLSGVFAASEGAFTGGSPMSAPEHLTHWSTVALAAAGLPWGGATDPALSYLLRAMLVDRRPPMKGEAPFWSLVLWSRMSAVRVTGLAGDVHERQASAGQLADAFIRLSQVHPDLLLVFGGDADAGRGILSHFAVIGMHGLDVREMIPGEGGMYAVRDTFRRIARCCAALEGFESHARTFGACADWYVAQIRTQMDLARGSAA